MNTNRAALPEHVWLRRFAKLLCLLTLVLIFLGGQVKSHEAGLSVPDWPLTYGENPITYGYSKWVGGIFHEHFHRLFAGIVAALTVVLAVWIGYRENRGRIVLLGAAAVLAVLFQALLGGLTVIYKLPVLVSSSHAILAQIFLLLTVVLAYIYSREFKSRFDQLRDKTSEGQTPLKAWSIALIAAIFLQLFLGALMRHTESGLAVYDFPTTAGQLLPVVTPATLEAVNTWRFDNTDAMGVPLPDVTATQIRIHLFHRFGACLVGGIVFALGYLGLTKWPLDAVCKRTLVYLMLLTAVQITLGAVTIWTAKLPLITSIHVAVGAAVLALATVLALRAWPINKTVSEVEAVKFSAEAVAS
ncbi:MAG: COX15/CtaA family protein [Candidatus Hydrogenedentes bacterium]|nr:COX15/CtaA family protein [Candidatus Hydrogenedentota bacterium]